VKTLASQGPQAGEPVSPAAPSVRGGWATGLLVVLLLVIHYALAFDSLSREDPTVDEIAHLPAGISYWQKGTFKLYHHNPPLTKLIAAIPVMLAKPETAALYGLGSWTNDPPSQANFGQSFAFLNSDRYFELFRLGRMTMPLFSVVGGLFIFAWSSRLYGRLGGLLSLSLWCLCPNILAHARLITSDVAGASIGLGATFLFWRYLHAPTWRSAIIAGVALGLAQLTKFNLLLLYAYWPLLWLGRWVILRDLSGWPARLRRDVAHGAAVVSISLLLICAGYGFEGVGKPFGSFEFASETLTRPTTPADLAKGRPRSVVNLIDLAWRHRINRFRGTWIGAIPAPLPSHFLLGFDDQRFETEGLPLAWFDPSASPGAKTGYPVYLDGEIRRTGWWYYYLACLAYKVPEGTWLLVISSMVALVATRRDRSAWFDEFAVLAFPAIMIFAMSALTDINLGIRYILPIFPFLFVAVGKLAPWVGSMGIRGRRLGGVAIAFGLALTTIQTALIHPSYLATFNWISGGPDRGSEHLIDSNLDWGQDLVGLQRWLAENRPGQSVGFAYFGQINPNIFLLRGQPFPWFLPPALPGTLESIDPRNPNPACLGPATRLRPGLYAVSASLVRGLPWRLYDSGPPIQTWSPAWNARGPAPAFGYFAELTPIATIGHSIFVYDLTKDQCDRLNPRFAAATASP
jgi:hypothetical protein